MMNTSNHSAFKLMLLASVMVLNGCGDRVAIADQAMVDIRNSQPSPSNHHHSRKSLRTLFIVPIH